MILYTSSSQSFGPVTPFKMKSCLFVTPHRDMGVWKRVMSNVTERVIFLPIEAEKEEEQKKETPNGIQIPVSIPQNYLWIK